MSTASRICKLCSTIRTRVSRNRLLLSSKRISGYGLPMSLVLMKADLDLWQPAEHTGTFRGNQLAFIGAAAALDYSIQVEVEHQVRQKQAFIETFLIDQIRPLHDAIRTR